MKSAAIITLLVLSVFIGNLFSQNTYEFLRIDMSARAASLGGTFVSNHDDPNIIFYNPAGINLLTESPISFSFVKHVLDINLASLSYSTEFENIGRFGGAIKYINYGTFVRATEDGMREGEFGAGDVAFILSYANSLDLNFNYGANIKFIYSKIDDRNSTGIAFDLGLNYFVPEQDLSVGFAAMNIGSQISSYYEEKEQLPLDVIVGVSKKLQHLPLRLSLDFHKLNAERDDFVQRFKAFSVGAEFTLSKVLRLRFGYDNEKRSDLKIGTSAGIAGFNAGLGALVSNYTFDYGFSSLGAIGALHRVTISTKL